MDEAERHRTHRDGCATSPSQKVVHITAFFGTPVGSVSIATAGPATPDLHTHVAVANKVQTFDGRWLSIDGRRMLGATIGPTVGNGA